MDKKLLDNAIELDVASAMAALQWHLDVGADHLMGETTVQLQDFDLVKSQVVDNKAEQTAAIMTQKHSEWVAQAVLMAKQADSLDALKQAIKDYDGLTFKKSAKNMVFADGNPQSGVMIIGDVPGTEEDRSGRPFMGAEGVLLERMFEAIGLKRDNDYYVTQMLNWRPPGNRSVSEAELQMVLPFIERHIALVKPKILVFLGNLTAKTMLDTATGLTRLRGNWQDYKCHHPELCEDDKVIPVMPLYHPVFLMRAPLQKAKAWSDLLMIQKRLQE